MKSVYYKNCYHRDSAESPRYQVRVKALGEQRVFEKDGFKIVAYYDSKQKMFTEESTGKIISVRKGKNKAEAIMFVEAMFDVIKNQLITTYQNYNVMDLPELESKEVNCVVWYEIRNWI